MSNGRTVWWPKDCAWWRWEWIVTLGEEFGSAGPAVIDWLECEAKLQNDGGFVKSGPRSVARGCFVDVVTVGHVLSRAVTLGLLEEYVEADSRFTCRISGWDAAQQRAGAALRKAKQRSGQSVNTGDQVPVVTVSHAESRPVTECPPTEQDSTGQKEATANAVAVAATPPLTDLDRQVEEICQEFSEHVRTTHGIEATSHEALVVKGWRDACRSMLTLDGLTAEQVRFAGTWVCRHHYWKKRIKSMPRLRSEMSEVAKEIRKQRDGGTVVHLANRKQSAGDLLEEINGGETA